MDKKIKKIHFVGIKGVGMTPLAIIAKQAGFSVTGSDIADDFITSHSLESHDIIPLKGFSAKNIDKVDLVVTTGAHGGFKNPEVLEATSRGIKVISQAQALGLFQKGEIIGKKFIGISVAGSHGKTTTSAMVATMLRENNMDPSYLVGTGDIPSLGSSGHLGKGKYFVAEADEYVVDIENDRTPKVLFQFPKIMVITNIDYDHPDYYESIDQVRSVFLEFTKNIEDGGVLIGSGEGEENRKFLSEYKGNSISFGFTPFCDYYATNVNFSNNRSYFHLKHKENSLGNFVLEVFGEQNVLNALAAIVVGIEIGLSIDQIKKGLLAYKGSKRRGEFVGELPNGALLFDDYAHHPNEIKKTLEGFRKNFPKHKIVCIFQPHTYSRTTRLLSDFIKAFDSADSVIISEVFPSFREEPVHNFSAKQISDEINKISGKSIFLKTKQDVIKYVDQNNFGKDVIVLTMGAGDIYKISEFVLKK